MPPPTSFSEIDVRIRVFGSDFVNPRVAAPAGVFVAEPRVLVSAGVRVEVNDGALEGRLSGLRVFADNRELPETSSAANPPKFSFQYSAADPAHGRGVNVEFRHENTVFSVNVEAPVADIVTPSAGQG